MYQSFTLWKAKINGLLLTQEVYLDGHVAWHLSKLFALSEIMSGKAKFALKLAEFIGEAKEE